MEREIALRRHRHPRSSCKSSRLHPLILSYLCGLLVLALFASGFVLQTHFNSRLSLLPPLWCALLPASLPLHLFIVLQLLYLDKAQAFTPRGGRTTSCLCTERANIQAGAPVFPPIIPSSDYRYLSISLTFAHLINSSFVSADISSFLFNDTLRQPVRDISLSVRPSHPCNMQIVSTEASHAGN